MSEDVFTQDAYDDELAIAFIRTQLPQELKEKFTDDDLYYILDVVNEYYAESGVLEAEPDDEGYVNIDLEAVADYVVKEAKKDEIGHFDKDEVLLIVQADMDYAESQDS